MSCGCHSARPVRRKKKSYFGPAGRHRVAGSGRRGSAARVGPCPPGELSPRPRWLTARLAASSAHVCRAMWWASPAPGYTQTDRANQGAGAAGKRAGPWYGCARPRRGSCRSWQPRMPRTSPKLPRPPKRPLSVPPLLSYARPTPSPRITPRLLLPRLTCPAPARAARPRGPLPACGSWSGRRHRCRQEGSRAPMRGRFRALVGAVVGRHRELGSAQLGRRRGCMPPPLVACAAPPRRASPPLSQSRHRFVGGLAEGGEARGSAAAR